MIDWTARCLDSFTKIERVIALNRGFLLLPVEASGPDLGRALARWLTERGHPTSLIEPKTDEEWRELPGRIYSVQVAQGGLVMVLGGTRRPPGFYEGIWLLNQKRDVLGNFLACPLLWCGPREFLAQTWERAPDFWSVRAVDRRLECPPAPFLPSLASAVYPAYDVWQTTEVADLQRRRWSVGFEIGTHLALDLVHHLLRADVLDEALSILDEVYLSKQFRDVNERYESFLLEARICLLRGQSFSDKYLNFEEIFQKEQANIFTKHKALKNVLHAIEQTRIGEWDKAQLHLQNAKKMFPGLGRNTALEVVMASSFLALHTDTPESGLRDLADAGITNEKSTVSHPAFETHFASDGGRFTDLLLETRAWTLRAQLLASLGDSEEALDTLVSQRVKIEGEASDLYPGQVSALLLRVARVALALRTDFDNQEEAKLEAYECAQRARILSKQDCIARERAREFMVRMEENYEEQR